VVIDGTLPIDAVENEDPSVGNKLTIERPCDGGRLVLISHAVVDGLGELSANIAA
jgi:hypothetical protein